MLSHALIKRIDNAISELASIRAEILLQSEDNDITGVEMPSGNKVPEMNTKSFLDVRMSEQFKSLNALLGGKIRHQADWDKWSSMVVSYGWKNVTTAASKIEPVKRWPDQVEQVIWDAKKAKQSQYDIPSYANKTKQLSEAEREANKIAISNIIKSVRR